MFKNPKEIFTLPKQTNYITFSDNNQIYSYNLKNLEDNINNLFIEKSSAEAVVSTFIEFWQKVKRFFSSTWQSLTDILNIKTSDQIKKNMQLAKNIDNIVAQEPVSEMARLIYQFNSQPSPLIAVMYDKSLPVDKKTKLFNALVKAKKYNQQQKNTDLPAKDDRSQYRCEGPPLLHAVQLANKEMIISLLENNADPDGCGCVIGLKTLACNGITALHLAVAENNLEAVQLLIEHGANINAKNEYDQTPLHAASSKEMAAYLINKGANVNIQDNYGNSPLHWAAKHNHLGVLETLLSAKEVIVDIQNNDGDTPLSMAAHYGVPATINYSYNFHQSQRNTLNKELTRDNLVCLEQLIKKGADINHQNKKGYTPLLLAILIGENYMGNIGLTSYLDGGFIKEKVAFLCENGSDTNKGTFVKSKREPSITPLQALYRDLLINYKIMHDQKKSIAEILIQHGANPKVLGVNDETLLHQCARNADPQGLTYFIEQCLLDPNTTNAKGVSPLEEFYLWEQDGNNNQNNEACIQILNNHGAAPIAKP